MDSTSELFSSQLPDLNACAWEGVDQTQAQQAPVEVHNPVVVLGLQAQATNQPDPLVQPEMDIFQPYFQLLPAAQLPLPQQDFNINLNINLNLSNLLGSDPGWMAHLREKAQPTSYSPDLYRLWAKFFSSAGPLSLLSCCCHLRVSPGQKVFFPLVLGRLLSA